MTLLSVMGLRAGYGGGDVLHDVDLQLEENDLTVILGANGAGKTTLMRAVSGMIPRRGTVRFDGADVSLEGVHALVRRGIAHVPQGRGTLPDLTVEENLHAGAHTRSKSERIDGVERWFATYPVLSERRRQKAGLLSGGEQQMLAVARAMMSNPRLLLCDEPSLGLSPLMTERLFESLRQLNREEGLAILLVEQNARLALEIATSAYLLEVGVLGRRRLPADLAEDDSVRAAYLGH